MQRWESLAPAELFFGHLLSTPFDRLEPFTFGMPEGDETRHAGSSGGFNKDEEVFICTFSGLLNRMPDLCTDNWGGAPSTSSWRKKYSEGMLPMLMRRCQTTETKGFKVHPVLGN